jgi:hypothetical protein
MILRAMPVIAYIVLGPPMPESSKDDPEKKGIPWFFRLGVDNSTP